MGTLIKLRRHLRQQFGRDFSSKYRWNHNPAMTSSQGGEDGIIEEIFRRLGIETGWFVEFGAWDGLQYSNTLALAQSGWRGVYIEGDRAKAEELRGNMKDKPRIITLCRYISLESDNRLDAILAGTPIPEHFDLLSIDIDGNDYWIWKSITEYSPKVVIIEYNSNFSPTEHRTIRYDPAHRWDGTMYYGASAAALVGLAEAKGYILVACTERLNLFFVRRDFVEGRFDPLPVGKVRKVKVHKQRRREEFVSPPENSNPSARAADSISSTRTGPRAIRAGGRRSSLS